MSTVYERNASRLREVLEFLAAAGTPTRKDRIFEHVAKKYPPEGDDFDKVSDGTTRWLNDLLWQTTNFVKAGWITKDGRGIWEITDQGRVAVQRFTDPTALQAESLRLFNRWSQAQKKLQRRAWLVRGSSVRGANIVREWLEEGWVSIAASQLPGVAHEVTPEEVAEATRQAYGHLKHQELKSKVDEVLAFVTKMSSGDLVLTTSDQWVYVGDLNGDWEWHESAERRSNLRRAVLWRNADNPIDFADLPAPLPAKLATGATVVDLTSELDLIDDLTKTPPSAATPSPGLHHQLPELSDALAEELLLEAQWVKRVRDLLDERRQIVLYGPPGTGKTYLARKLAADLVGPEQVSLVQFHPAYTYEDFFEGFRPNGGEGGSIGFELRAGPLRRLVSRAVEHREQAFILIIDEINRANLAKVFGELYFLLEYRDEAVELMYSTGDDPFSLPPNIYLIGTMNTADRSVALVDSAIRRRFAFVALDPSAEPTRSLLRKWSTRHGLPPMAADLLEELNRRIDDPDFQIGPSYFMRSTASDAFSHERLERIWSADLEPLLQEHFYGRWDSEGPRFALDSLLRALSLAADRATSVEELAGPPDGAEEPGSAPPATPSSGNQ